MTANAIVLHGLLLGSIQTVYAKAPTHYECVRTMRRIKDWFQFE